jgi:hypothetical protein
MIQILVPSERQTKVTERRMEDRCPTSGRTSRRAACRSPSAPKHASRAVEQQKQEHFELGAVEREGMKSSTLRPCWYGNWDRLLADHRA